MGEYENRLGDYEGGIDIRREDGAADQRILLSGRENSGEVQLTLRNDGAMYGNAMMLVDLAAMEAYELAGALRAAADRASGTRWEAQDIAQLTVESVLDEVDRKGH